MPSLKPYSQELEYSYAPGLFPSLELMRVQPERALRLLTSEKAHGEGVEKLRAICREHNVREEVADKALRRISGKDNCFAAMVFSKWQAELRPELPHVVLHHPMDEGNLGTIQRTLLGLGLKDIAVIRPAADVFEPHVVRAAMGAVFPCGSSSTTASRTTAGNIRITRSTRLCWTGPCCWKTLSVSGKRPMRSFSAMRAADFRRNFPSWGRPYESRTAERSIH